MSVEQGQGGLFDPNHVRIAVWESWEFTVDVFAHTALPRELAHGAEHVFARATGPLGILGAAAIGGAAHGLSGAMTETVAATGGFATSLQIARTLAPYAKNPQAAIVFAAISIGAGIVVELGLAELLKDAAESIADEAQKIQELATLPNAPQAPQYPYLAPGGWELTDGLTG
jgi:hypothetical protein